MGTTLTWAEVRRMGMRELRILALNTVPDLDRKLMGRRGLLLQLALVWPDQTTQG